MPNKSWKAEYLEAFRQGWAPGSAAQRAGVEPSTVVAARRADPAFSAEYDAIWDAHIAGIERARRVAEQDNGGNIPLWLRVPEGLD